jgi:WD40 repeat protein/serine/threonine protein kinase
MAADERIVELLSGWRTRPAQGEPTNARHVPTGGTTVDAHQAALTEGFQLADDPGSDGVQLDMLGPYRIVSLLGAGGMGVVLQAIDERLGRQVALKVLRSSLAHDASAQERFLREARAAAALEHDHIVTIYHVGEDRGIPFLAMPLLSGTSLETRLHQAEPLPITEILRIGREIAEGLDAAHARKMIHRDIKPANIWLEGERGRVKILDFGLVRAVDEAQRLTHDDTIVGTPAYMAPEQAISGQQIDPRLDLFSLGSVLYQMATSRLPFEAAGAVKTLMATAHAEVVPPRTIRPEIPPALNDLIVELLARDPAHRPASARAVAERITAIEDSGYDDIPLIRLDHPEPPHPRTRARAAGTRVFPWIVGAALSLVLFGLLAVIVPRLIGLFDNKGRLTIETPLPYVLVVVKQSGHQVAVIDPTRRSTVALWPGAYELALDGEHSGLQLSTERIVVERGADLVVNVIPRSETASAVTEVIAPGAGSTASGEAVDLDLPGLIAPSQASASASAGLRRRQVETRLPRSPVHALAFSPNRHRLACVAEHERVVRIYDAERLELVALLVGHTAPIDCLAWSPVNRQLATASQDGTVRFWSAEGIPGPIVKEHGGSPLCLAWSPNGQWLAVGGTDRSVQLWKPDGTRGPVLEGPGASISALAWSPEGQRLVVGTAQGQVQLLQPDGTRTPLLEANTHPVLSVSWSADGTLVAAGGHDGARLWKPDGTPGPTFEDAPSGIACLAWSPTTPTLAAACPDGTVRLWNAEGQPGPIMAGPAGSKAITAGVPTSSAVLKLVWSADGESLASAGQDGTVRQWSADGTPGPVLTAHLSPFRSLAWSLDGKRLVTDFPLRHALRIWELSLSQARGRFLEGSEGTVYAVAWSPDGRSLAAGDAAGVLRLWSEDGTPGRVFRSEAGSINAVAWSPDSRRLAVGDANNTVHLYRLDDDKDKDKDKPDGVVLTGHTAQVLCVAWSPDGRSLASGGHDWTIRLWKVSERTSRVLGKLGQRVVALAWSPGGDRLAVACPDALVRIFRTDESTSEPLILKGHTGPVRALSWSRDGLLATGGADSSVRIWSAEGAPGPTLEVGGGPISALAWSADGRHLATAGDDGTLRLWNVAPLRIDRIFIPTSPVDLAILDRSGQLVYATPGARRDLCTYSLSPRGAATLASFSEPEPRPESKARRVPPEKRPRARE